MRDTGEHPVGSGRIVRDRPGEVHCRDWCGIMFFVQTRNITYVRPSLSDDI